MPIHGPVFGRSPGWFLDRPALTVTYRTAVCVVYFPARGTESSGGRLTDHPKLIEKFSRGQIGRLERSPKWSHPMRYSDYKCFRFGFDSGVAFVSIDHPPINLLDEVLSQEFDKLGRELEADEGVRVVVLQSALPDFFIAHSGLGRVGAASKMEWAIKKSGSALCKTTTRTPSSA